MSEEAGFLSASGANPTDRTTRLIYADWLEDRGESRGELIRIEEEMRLLPVFCDRFWLLKARRNELRSQTQRDWLRDMGYDGSACPPTFTHGVPDGWKERWRLIRELVERWHQIPLDDIGGRGDEIRTIEARLGRTLPPAAREWVAFAHDARCKSTGSFVFLGTYRVENLVGQLATSLMLDSEEVYHWAIRHEDFAVPDPPVYGFDRDYASGNRYSLVRDERNPIATDLTTFVLDYATEHLSGSGGSFRTTRIDNPGRVIEYLKAEFPVRCSFGAVELFETENVLVRLSPSERWPGDMRMGTVMATSAARGTLPSFLLGC